MRCHLAKRTSSHFRPWVHKCEATSGAISHLRKQHNVDKIGNSLSKPQGHRNWQQTGSSQTTPITNVIAPGFDYNDFQAKLYDWLISDNVAFNQPESEKFQELLIYLQPRIKRYIPCRTTARRIVTSIHDRSIGVVTEKLATAITKINLSFDLWTSGNKLALLGLCALLSRPLFQPLSQHAQLVPFQGLRNS